MIFEDLKVIELAGVLAGPSVGMFFAELGAEVIKVENRAMGGDMTRSWRLAQEDKNKITSAYFSSINYRKQYLDLNLKEKEDHCTLMDMIREADILLTNFKSGSDTKLGLDPKQVKEVNPRLIYAKIEGFTSKPEKVAFDVVLQAESGFLGMTGSPEGELAKMPVALSF